MRAYWPRPSRIAAIAASLTKSGPSKSGNPWARLMAPCSTASRVISVKMVVPKPSSRRAIMGSGLHLPHRGSGLHLPHRGSGLHLPHRGSGSPLAALRSMTPHRGPPAPRIYLVRVARISSRGKESHMPPSRIHYRVAIIGSGPAGWTAALYASRADLEPIVIEGPQPGGQLTITTEVENYPGFPKGIQGPEMMEIFRDQARRFGTEGVLDVVTDVDFEARPFRLTLDSGANLTADAVIIAAGASAKALGISSERQPGVSACATCDGPLPAYRGKELVVVGGGDTAMEEATFLTKFATKVTIVHRREEFRASRIMLDRARANAKIHWKLNAVVEEIHGNGAGVTGVTLRDTQAGALSKMSAGGVFVAIGHLPIPRSSGASSR